MAEFAPEVGMDIGASNVRPQSGPSADFSAVGRFMGSIFDQGSDTSPSEASLKKAALDPIIADGNRIAQIEDTMQRKVLMDVWFTRAMASAGSNYRTDIEGIYKDYTGIESPSVNSEMSLKSKVVTDFAGTDEGKAVLPYLMNQAKDETGNVNQAYLEALLFDEATTVSSDKAYKEKVKADLETGKASAEQSFYGAYTPSGQRQNGLIQNYQKKWNEEVLRLTSSASVQALMADLQQNGNNPDYNTESLLRVVAEIEQSRDSLDSQQGQELVNFGYNLSDEGIKAAREALKSNHNTLINTLKTKPTFIVNMAKALEDKAKVVEASGKLTTSQAQNAANNRLIELFGPMAMVPEMKEQIFIKYVSQVSDEDLIRGIGAIKGDDKNSFAIFNTPTMFGGPGYINSKPPQQDGQQETGAANPAPSVPWNDEAVKNFATYTPDQVKATVETGGYIMKATDTLDATDVKESVNTVSASLLSGFANRTAKYLDPSQMKAFVNDDMVNYFGRVEKDAPDLMPNLLEQADAFMDSEVSKNVEPLATMIKNISGPEGSIFDFNFDPQSRVLTATVSDRAYAQLAWVRAAVDMSGSREATKVMEAAAKSGNPVPFRGAADVKEFKDNMENITYVLATINKLPPSQQKRFTKTVKTVQSSLVSLSKTMPVPVTTFVAEAGKAAADLPKVVQENLPTLREIFSLQDSLSNVQSPEEERAIMAKIESLKETIPQKALNLSPNDITNIKINTRKTESAAQTSELNARQPRRIRWNEIAQGGAGR